VSGAIVLVVTAGYSVFAALVSYGFTRLTGLSLWTLQPDRSADFSYILLMNLAVWGSWSVFAPAAFELARRAPFNRAHWRRALAVHLPAALVITGGHILLVATARYALQSAWDVPAIWTTSVRDAFFRTLDFELPIYWTFVGIQHAVDYYHQVRAREVAAAQLETKLVESQLQALQRQLHPHFLFNTLHAIAALVHRDPPGAELMIERLSDLLRAALKPSTTQTVPLADELAHLRTYLAIEQVHFGDRLEVRYDVDAGTLSEPVPPLILQPLAENAIRHGLEPQAGRGELTLVVRRTQRTLRLQVIDNGRGISSGGGTRPTHGIGWSNTRARLERLYGDAARLEVRSREGAGVEVTIEIPLIERSADEDSCARGRRSAPGPRSVDRAAV
jgi:signal transduction histidine kinase